MSEATVLVTSLLWLTTVSTEAVHAHNVLIISCTDIPIIQWGSWGCSHFYLVFNITHHLLTFCTSMSLLQLYVQLDMKSIQHSASNVCHVTVGITALVTLTRDLKTARYVKMVLQLWEMVQLTSQIAEYVSKHSYTFTDFIPSSNIWNNWTYHHTAVLILQFLVIIMSYYKL